MLTSLEFTSAMQEARDRLRVGDELEVVLLGLRKRGANKIDSIRIMRQALGISVPQAKSLIDRSDTWADRYSRDQAFHQHARTALSRLAEESKDVPVFIEESSPDPVKEE